MQIVHYRDLTQAERARADWEHEQNLLSQKSFSEDLMSWYDNLTAEERAEHRQFLDRLDSDSEFVSVEDYFYDLD